jgi:hypothetical protein
MRKSSRVRKATARGDEYHTWGSDGSADDHLDDMIASEEEFQPEVEERAPPGGDLKQAVRVEQQAVKRQRQAQRGRQRVYEQIVKVSIDASDAPELHVLSAGTQGWSPEKRQSHVQGHLVHWCERAAARGTAHVQMEVLAITRRAYPCRYSRLLDLVLAAGLVQTPSLVRPAVDELVAMTASADCALHYSGTRPPYQVRAATHSGWF